MSPPLATKGDGSSSDVHTERTATQLVAVVAAFLLLFALVYLYAYPTRERASFSELDWVHRPVISSVDANRFIDFTVRVQSHELTQTPYRVSAYLEDSFVDMQRFSLEPGNSKEVAFHFPTTRTEAQHEVRVIVSRARAEDMKGEAPTELELVDWAVRADQNIEE